MDQLNFMRAALRTRYESIKSQNPGFSYRAFAKSIGIAVSTLSEFIAAKKDISSDLLEKIKLKTLETEAELKAFESLPFKLNSRLETINSLEQLTDLPANQSSIYKLDKSDQYLIYATERSVREINNRIDGLIRSISDLLDEQEEAALKKLVVFSIQKPVVQAPDSGTGRQQGVFEPGEDVFKPSN